MCVCECMGVYVYTKCTYAVSVSYGLILIAAMLRAMSTVKRLRAATYT